MVQSMIDIPEEANQIINIIKARYNLKTKSEAISKIVLECGVNILEPELRPEFVDKLNEINDNASFVSFGSIEDLKNVIENEEV